MKNTFKIIILAGVLCPLAQRATAQLDTFNNGENKGLVRGKINAGILQTNTNTTDIAAGILQTNTNTTDIAATLSTSQDAVLGDVTVNDLTVSGSGNVLTDEDLSSGIATNDANKVLQLDENGKIDAEYVETIIIMFAGGEAVDVP